MKKTKKGPGEIPFPPEKPEIIPPEEQPTRTWPERDPEIVPGKDPERVKPPNEIPAPPKSRSITNSENT